METTSLSLINAIAGIDNLIRQLQSGAFASAAVAAPTAVPIAAAPAPTKPARAPKTRAPKPDNAQPDSAAAPKPAKPAKAPKAAAGGAGVESPDLFAKAHIVVARVLSVAEHPNSEKLFITQLDIGGGETRQIVAGLRKYVTAEELQGATVAAVLNLKPAKLAGELSSGMILAASVPEGAQAAGVAVKPLVPDAAAAPGELLRIEGGAAPDVAAFPKALKGDHWRKIVAGLAVKGGAACFDGKPLASESATVMAPGMPDGSTIS